ncbi:phage portal protein [Silvimonas sp.]|uniref:phage portal protein n=1 Tax=Silvimonas sp. TaxID=2650811 RepID=UPI00283DD9AF|nr:phage portal protein [Silvimonas sp.]MDR3427951.1 phage portal protein [Silvimonas sp.]
MTQPSWYDAGRVSQPGSVVLARWNAERQAAKAQTGRSVGAGTTVSELQGWLYGDAVPSAGMVVNERTAMLVSAVYAAVSLIGGAVANLPLQVFRNTPEGLQRVDAEHSLWWLFNEQPSTIWSAPVAWEYAMTSLLFHGDSFWRVLRPSPFSSDISGFEPWNPLAVDVQKIDGRLKYTMVDDLGAVFVLDQDDVLHVPGVGFNGLRGMSALRHGALRQAVGVARAADDYAGSFFANGARPDFALSTDEKKLSEESVELLRETWSERHQGPGRAHRPAILTGGLKVQELTMSAEDAQLLETRRFEIEDIARIFGVPPHMIGAMDKTTAWGSGIEQLAISFVRFTLSRHLVKFQAEINRKCFRTARYQARFDTWALERGDLKTLFDALRSGVGRVGEPGIISINEARERLGYTKHADGDTLSKGILPNEKTAVPSGAQ